MKKFLCCLLALSIVISLGGFSFTGAFANVAEADGDNRINVWLIAGQSNAMGYAMWSNYPSDSQYVEYKSMLEAGSENVWYMGTTDTAFTKTKSSATRTGAEIGIATALMEDESENAIIKVAWGNTSLYNNTSSNESKKYGTWTPPSYIKKHNIETDSNKVGDLYLTFMKKIKYGIDRLKDKGYTPVIKGIWYMQGEADTFSSTPASCYQELLETLISDMRGDIGEITGINCSELPFVYGRVLRNPGINPDTGAPYTDATPYISVVQAAQDAVNAKNLKNVFMIDTTTDLTDPVTGLHREPYQQDGWHYDSITQQMIGEKLVERINSVTDISTKYGFIPYENRDLPLAVFKLNNDGKTYTYDGSFDTIKLALERARALTLASAPVTAEAVVYVTKDFAHNNYPSNMSDVGGKITIDLNGHTLAPTITLIRTDVDDCMETGETAQKKCVINIKNGNLKLGNYGVIYNTSGSTYTKVKSFEINFDNVNLGFYQDYTSKASNYNDLIVTDRNYTSSLEANFDINLNNCTLDLSTNAKADASFGVLNTNNPATDKCTSNYDISFKDCEFIAKSEANLGAQLSASGDSVAFIKGEDGAFGRVILPEGNYEKAFNGIDNGSQVSLGLKPTGEVSGANKVYSLVAKGDVTTSYGVIPSSYSDSRDYPLAVFKKNKDEENYTFVAGYGAWKSALSGAAGYINGASGATKEDEAVVLLRRDFSFSDLYTSSAIGGTLTFDLNGFSLSYGTALMNTGNADFSSGKGGETYINIKNGKLYCNTTYGMFYAQVKAENTVAGRGYIFNFENVSVSYGEAGTAASLLMHLNIASNLTSSTPDFKYDMTFNNCVIDMKGAPDGAYIAKLDKNVGAADTYNKVDASVTFKGGKIIGANEADIAFSSLTDGDGVYFGKNTNEEYTKIVLNSDESYPSELVFVSDNGKYLILGNYTDNKLTYEYSLKETNRILTPYGEIPAEYSDEEVYPFALFSKASGGSYQFSQGFGTYKTAMNAAINLTKSSLAAPAEEAVVYLRRDWADTGYPSGTSSVKTKITLDLNGKTLGALESLCNTATGNSNDSSGSVVPTSGVIEVKNGKLLSKIHGFLYIAKAGSYTQGSPKTLTFNFNNVDFGFSEGATSVSLIGRVASNHTTEYATFKLNFNNCTFDMVTNRPTREDLVLANWTLASDYSIVNSSFTDCEFKGNSEADFIGSLGDNDTAVYGKTEGDYYSLLTLPESSEAPSGKYQLKDSMGVFYEMIKTDGKVTYGLMAKKATVSEISVTKYTNYKTSSEYKTTVLDKDLFSDGILTAASGSYIDYASSGNVTTYGLDATYNSNQYWSVTLDKIYTLDAVNLNYGYTNKWVDFNVRVSENNKDWTDLGTIRPKVAANNGEFVSIPLDSVRAKYIEIKVIKRNGTNAASTATTAWGANLGAGCTLTIYEMSFSGEAEEFNTENLFKGFDKVFSQTDTFTFEGKEITAPVGIVFARAGEDGGYTRIRYGVMLSFENISKSEFENNENTVKAYGEAIGPEGQYGIRFFGSKIRPGVTCYALPFAEYEGFDGENITLYGENIINFTPEI
ncbi:MAG: hypothetical protein E7411_05130 [Ruminococcaceae bacterium]|nr:hypothetical protein [Oscillospiraceae bacterium]